MKIFQLAAGIALVIVFLAIPASARQISVAAASDLKFALQDIAAQYQKQTGAVLTISYGSSGNFFAQLQNGAPFDIFFSADIAYPRKLEAAGFTEPGTLYEYAVGRVVIWAPPDSALDLAHRGWKALLDPAVRKIAIANPAHAPYGRAAVAAMKAAGVYSEVQHKLVLGENISQTAQFVQSGNAQAGIVALSLAVSPPMKDGKCWEIPASEHPAIEQAAVVMKNSANKQAAAAFLDYVKSPAGRAVLRAFGFTFPAAGAKRAPEK